MAVIRRPWAAVLGASAVVLAGAVFPAVAAAQHEPPNAVPGEVQFSIDPSPDDPSGVTLRATYSTSAYHDQQCASRNCSGNDYLPYSVEIYLDRPDGQALGSEGGHVTWIPHCTDGSMNPAVACNVSGRAINNPADALPGAGTITFKLASAAPPGSTAEIVVEAYSVNSFATAPVKVIEHYSIELKAWIPHGHIVDPIYPVPLPLGGSTPDSCLHASGLGVQSSNFSGDNHAVYDGSSRAAVTLNFDWDGQTMTASSQPPAPQTVFSHRNWRYSFFGSHNPKLRTCTQAKQADNSNRAFVKDNVATLSLSSPNPFFELWPSKINYAPSISSRLEATFTNPTTLLVTIASDTFPSHGFSISKNGQPIFTAVSQNSSCVTADGLAGAGVAQTVTQRAFGLAHTPRARRERQGHADRLQASAQHAHARGAAAGHIAAPRRAASAAQRGRRAQRPGPHARACE
jgi:hypothetical protein